MVKLAKAKEYVFVDRAFNIALIYKTIFAVFETILGFTMMFITPQVVDNIFDYLQRQNILGSGFIATHLLNWQANFSSSGQWIAVIYLLSHGIIKLVIYWFLFKRVEKAYPISIVVLVLFIIYQLYEFIFRHSILLLLACIVDLIVIWLTVLEYRRMRGKW